MPHSHHSHSGQFCKHASGLLEDVVLEAISQGFEVYGLTEHVPRYRESDLYPEEAGFSLDALSKQFDDFLAEAHRLKKQYALKINILVGLETESITSADLDCLQALLERVGDRVEYIVGSVHHVNEIPIDFDVPTYQTALESFANHGEDERLPVFLSSYFDAQYELLQRFRPEVIGHFDLCRLYTPTIRFSDYPSVWKRIERNITYAVEYGALFEVNTAAFRKKWDSAYPAEDIVKTVLKHGGHFALSDDSHGPHAVGLNYHRVVGYLQSVGVSEIWYLKPSSSSNAAGRTMAPVKLDGDWWNHPFWRKRVM
ncbi:Polymerase/histidinol phosphatase-like protein [Crucibulum laeve]|uniref:Histidinol-phosphatase n=1 Tax=Crucibulum laeve TaxID=68775 RepID=A0A5C3LFP9_9AGAR|nr:Polymerase/histidinol phosphatase-like protein [Crucibulum laeve]